MHGRWRRTWSATLALALAGGAAAAEGTVAPDLYLDQDGVRIHLVDRGQGEPVILLHGFTMSLESAWQTPRGGAATPSILDALAAGHRVVALDARGHGKSDKPHECDRYGAAMAGDVLRVMDALRIRRAHLVGFSMGGTTAAYLAIHHPERFRSVVLLAPKVERLEALPGGRDAGMDDIARSLDQGEGLRPLFRALTPPGAPPMSDAEVVAQDERILRGQDAAALACAARSLAELAIPERALAQLKVPVLVVVGAQDPLQAGAREVAGRVPGARLRVVEGATHPTLLGWPGLMAEVQAFLAVHRSR
jgi:pimeloyl-ACP methyl ester carboxylesterase